jgi:hypothetical protein
MDFQLLVLHQRSQARSVIILVAERTLWPSGGWLVNSDSTFQPSPLPMPVEGRREAMRHSHPRTKLLEMNAKTAVERQLQKEMAALFQQQEFGRRSVVIEAPLRDFPSQRSLIRKGLQYAQLCI